MFLAPALILALIGLPLVALPVADNQRMKPRVAGRRIGREDGFYVFPSFPFFSSSSAT